MKNKTIVKRALEVNEALDFWLHCSFFCTHFWILTSYWWELFKCVIGAPNNNRIRLRDGSYVLASVFNSFPLILGHVFPPIRSSFADVVSAINEIELEVK